MKYILILLSVLIVNFHADAQNLAAGTSELDSLKNSLRTAKDDSNKVKILSDLSWSYVYSFPDSALKYSLQGATLAEKKGRKSDQIYLLTVMSQALAYKGNLSQSLKRGFSAMELSEKLKSEYWITWCNVCIGSVYFYAEDYSTALQYFLKTKTYPREYKNSNPPYCAFIGETYFHLNQFDSAMLYIQQSYDLQKKSGSNWSVPYLYMGKLYEKNGNFQVALSFYRASMNAIVPITDSIKGCLAIANYFKHANAADSGIYYAKLAFAVAQKTSSYIYISNISSMLRDFYKSLQQKDSALKYQDIMIAAKDSLLSWDKINQIQNVAFNEQQRQQDILKEKAEFRNKIKVYGLVSGLIVFAIISIILLRSNQFKQRAKIKIEQAYENLKTTQQQLIQSEKMASLGELTAGIAHEIQNPLNFVNNFSEVNKELIHELHEEIAKGNFEEVKNIATDIANNQERINEHGKRADGIVKSMLQHSRISSGQKELTDINALADEYLRLSYHGMRAKNKSFNATIVTDFDSSLNNVSVIPQDIGRVMINLFNNAFHSMMEKVKSNHSGYEPAISVTTGKLNGKIKISVKDNGNGIPEKLKHKIFQPFFTTKPTGTGTGLGLSLSYDIITKEHGGEIKVESKEGEYAEFIIFFPANQIAPG